MTTLLPNSATGAEDLYAAEANASAIATAERIHLADFDLAELIVDSTDPLTLLQGFTNSLLMSVQLVARFAGVPEEDVFDMLRDLNRQVASVAAGS